MTTTAEWMEKVNKDSALLRGFLSAWHPLSRGIRKPLTESVTVLNEQIEIEAPITAPGAEQACQVIRKQIVESNDGDPLRRFDIAVAAQDYSTIDCLLNEAWFGVPESRSCWQIPGFTEAVELMEDPPEDADDAN